MTKFHRFHVLQFQSKQNNKFHLAYNIQKKLKVCTYNKKQYNTNK